MLAARFGDCVDDASGGAARVCPEVVCYDRHLPQGVRVWQRRGCVVLLVVVIVPAIYSERVRKRTRAIDYKTLAPLPGRKCRRGARHEERETIQNAPALCRRY